MLTPRLTGETIHCDEDWFIRPDGTFYPISWWAAPIDLPTGRGVIVSFSDITEQREMQRAAHERDAAELRAQLSRAAGRRIVESVATANREMARDLHDGAQQRLVTLLINLQLARADVSGIHSSALQRLDAAISDAQTAIGELRTLSAGIHPEILTSRGLTAALTALARRCPLPVEVISSVAGRVNESVESAAYFIASEAITNALKYSAATHIEVVVELTDALTLTVADDGIGGVPQTRVGHEDNLGLVGMCDRVGAFDGSLTVVSPRGVGTTVRAEFPIRAKVDVHQERDLNQLLR